MRFLDRHTPQTRLQPVSLIQAGDRLIDKAHMAAILFSG
jgi:hypothetical protein